jgi:Beta-lactamase enzyme family
VRARFLGYGSVAALVVATASFAAGSPQPWRPNLQSAVQYASHRHGTIAFAVRTPTRFWGWHANETFPSASVLKAMLLAAYLDMPSVRNRPLRPADRALLTPMIRQSDNDAATRVLAVVGSAPVYGVASRAHMRRFTLVTHPWGLTRIDAADQSRYLLRIDRLVVPRHRAYGMNLLRTITPVQRWGIARVRPHGWRLYFKGGWGDGTGWVDHQVALLTRGDDRVSVAILTLHDQKHDYGRETLRGIALRLMRGLDSAQAVP